MQDWVFKWVFCFNNPALDIEDNYRVNNQNSLYVSDFT